MQVVEIRVMRMQVWRELPHHDEEDDDEGLDDPAGEIQVGS